MAIIGIAGTKQSGKDSTAKLISAMVMKHVGIIRDFEMLPDTTLSVKQEVITNGTMSIQTNILDLERRDTAFMNMLYEIVWPHVKTYHFADSLKYVLANLFRLDIDKLFGGNSEKDESSPIKWKNMLDVVPKRCITKQVKADEFMTYRQVMQHFADIMRNIDDSCFINYTLDEIAREQYPISLIADVRREVEVDAIKAAGGKIIYLTRRVDNDDKHQIENDLLNTDKSKFDIVIDNQNLTLAEKNVRVINELKDVGFLQ